MKNGVVVKMWLSGCKCGGLGELVLTGLLRFDFLVNFFYLLTTVCLLNWFVCFLIRLEVLVQKQKYLQEMRDHPNFVCSTSHPLALYSDSFILNFQEVLNKFHKSEISQSGCCSVIVWQIGNFFK